MYLSTMHEIFHWPKQRQIICYGYSLSIVLLAQNWIEIEKQLYRKKMKERIYKHNYEAIPQKMISPQSEMEIGKKK